MEDVHAIFTIFKEEYPEVYQRHEEEGRYIHDLAKILPDKERWLTKVAMSGASGHQRSLETHIQASREAGASEEEIKAILLLLVPTCGFPTFMEAYTTYKELGA